MAASVHVLVGTRKALFVYSSDMQRKEWTVSEPMLPGWSIANAAADTRDGKPRLYAAATHDVWGPSIAKSTDGGDHWQRLPGTLPPVLSISCAIY